MTKALNQVEQKKRDPLTGPMWNKGKPTKNELGNKTEPSMDTDTNRIETPKENWDQREQRAKPFKLNTLAVI